MDTPKMTKGHQRVMPYFLVEDAAALMDLMREAFGATERLVTRDDAGRIGHAEMTIGESVLMLGNASEQWPARPCAVYLYVNDVDGTHARCLQRGCSEIYAPREEPYGVRGSGVCDAWGNTWWIAQMH